MKTRALFCFTFLFLVTLCYSQNTTNSTTTYFFIRHAEKEESNTKNSNPHLSEKGKKRAIKWSNYFTNINFDAIYSTNYHRTIETAKPTAQKNQLALTFYNPLQVNVETFLEETKGKTVLVVGHSNTIPRLVNHILGEEKYPDISENNNGNLYILTLIDNTVSDVLLSIN